MTQTNYTIEDIGNKFRDGIASKDEVKGSSGNVSNPLFEMPLISNLCMTKGTDAGEFTRVQSNVTTYIDMYSIMRYSTSDEARFEKEGLLLEGPSTNYLLNSDFASNWNGSASYNLNSTVSPDGNTNAIKINGVDGTHITRHTDLVDDSIYTFSVWLKGAAGGETLSLLLQEAGGAYNWYANKYITLSNRWERYSVTGYNSTATGIPLRVVINGFSVFESAFAFAPQLERLNHASSYIPTTTKIESRNSDILEIEAKDNFPSVTDEKTITLDYTPMSLTSKLYREVFSVTGIHHQIIRAQTNGIYTLHYNNAGLNTVPLTPNKTQRLFFVQSGGETSNISFYLENQFVHSGEATVSLIGSPTNIRISTNSRPAWGHVKNLRIYAETFDEVTLAML